VGVEYRLAVGLLAAVQGLQVGMEDPLKALFVGLVAHGSPEFEGPVELRLHPAIQPDARRQHQVTVKPFEVYNLPSIDHGKNIGLY
jgi:hypothetical protein